MPEVAQSHVAQMGPVLVGRIAVCLGAQLIAANAEQARSAVYIVTPQALGAQEVIMHQVNGMHDDHADIARLLPREEAQVKCECVAQ